MAKKEISLLTKPPFDLTLKGRVVNWLVTWGRAILVLVELVVISAFFSRFWLDRKNSDLSDDVRQKRVILENTLEFEEQFRDLKKRMEEVEKILAQERELRFPLLLISRSLPAGVWLKSISFQENDFPQAHLVIQVVSEQGLSDFISLLLSQPEVKGVTVGSIRKEKTFSEVEIGLTVKFVADAGRKQ